ncbi:Right handed beta helix domain-containing protein [Plasmodiophora brassicae]|uniref:Right handed beta helix domain-containing protein n=1 Tax=Plasmodiophora brassicae TaxID=37360 RepID=A0A0G4IM89_PLABS|nr:hypothetical protein PBRA_004878 [Plasmodiophora brassicae]SPQ99140.1 unnamed protein product [Plasmodiophora brassicae]
MSSLGAPGVSSTTLSIEGTTTPGCQRREFATQRTLLQVWRSVDESGSDVAHAHGLRRPLAASCMLDLRVHARPTWLERCAESIGASPHCGPGAAVFVPRLMWSSTLTVVVRRWAAGSTLTTEPVRVGRELTVREMMAQCQDGAAGDPPTVFMDSGGIHDPWPLFPDMIEMCDLDQPLSVLKQLGFARFTLCPSDDDSCRNDLIVNAPTKPAPKRMLTSVKEKNAKNRKLQAKRVTVMYDKRILIVDPTRSADLPSFTTITDALEAAEDGDQIVVSEGTYTERIEIRKAIMLRAVDSARAGNVVLTSKNVTLPAVKIMVSGVTIRGITAIKKSSPRSKRYPAVIDVDRRLDRIVIADCVIDGSWEHKPCTLAFEPKCLCGSRCHGIFFDVGSNGRVERCVIKNSSDCALVVNPDGSVVVVDTEIRKTHGIGVWVPSRTVRSRPPCPVVHGIRCAVEDCRTPFMAQDGQIVFDDDSVARLTTGRVG